MFDSLKSKLKNWLNKNKDAPDTRGYAERRPIAETPKKEKKKIKTKKPKNELELSLKKTIETPIEKESFFSKFKKRLTEEKFEELFQELEMILLQNNVAYEAVQSIKNSLAEKLIGKILNEVDLSKELKESIESILINPPDFLKEIKNSLEIKKPFVILFAGINGSGKTTTIAKVANYLQKNKLTVCLAAADTFRAAAIQQLEEHATKLKVPLTKKDYGSDPASVGFEAIARAKKNKIDVVLIDTAGRMQNRDSLMKEIEKISRITKPNMTIFIGESITGNDATEQAKTFNDAINITGIILSKADVDEKGGTAISVSHITKKPILFLGTGQSYNDLEIFDKKKIIEKLEL
ncbi:MAG: signal recognition particle-docking protein FtsY [archaeon]